MTLLKTLKNFVLFSFVLAFTACDVDGPPGPMGPPGPQGFANVTGTEHITLNTWYFNQDYNWYESSVNVPEITRDIRDFGLVMVYQRLTTNPNARWIPLPDTYDNVTTNYDFSLGNVTVYSFHVDNSTPIAPTGMVVRIVVIPSSVRKANPNANWNNYEEVHKLITVENQIQTAL